MMSSVSIRRELYSISRSGQECLDCMKYGNIICWGYKPRIPAAGEPISPLTAAETSKWTESFCCSPSDFKCRELHYCTDKVTKEELKRFTCPTDHVKCPVGEQTQIRLNSKMTTPQLGMNVKHEWPNFEIRHQLFCKFLILFERPSDDSAKNTFDLRLQIGESSNSGMNLFWMKSAAKWDDSVAQVKLASGNSVRVQDIGKGEQIWLMYEPTLLQTGKFSLQAWVDDKGSQTPVTQPQPSTPTPSNNSSSATNSTTGSSTSNGTTEASSGQNTGGTDSNSQTTTQNSTTKNTTESGSQQNTTSAGSSSQNTSTGGSQTSGSSTSQSSSNSTMSGNNGTSSQQNSSNSESNKNQTNSSTTNIKTNNTSSIPTFTTTTNSNGDTTIQLNPRVEPTIAVSGMPEREVDQVFTTGTIVGMISASLLTACLIILCRYIYLKHCERDDKSAADASGNKKMEDEEQQRLSGAKLGTLRFDSQMVDDDEKRKSARFTVSDQLITEIPDTNSIMAKMSRNTKLNFNQIQPFNDSSQSARDDSNAALIKSASELQPVNSLVVEQRSGLRIASLQRSMSRKGSAAGSSRESHTDSKAAELIRQANEIQCKNCHLHKDVCQCHKVVVEAAMQRRQSFMGRQENFGSALLNEKKRQIEALNVIRQKAQERIASGKRRRPMSGTSDLRSSQNVAHMQDNEKLFNVSEDPKSQHGKEMPVTPSKMAGMKTPFGKGEPLRQSVDSVINLEQQTADMPGSINTTIQNDTAEKQSHIFDSQDNRFIYKKSDVMQGNRATPAFKAGAKGDSEKKDSGADVTQLPSAVQQSVDDRRMSEIIEERTEDYYNTKNSQLNQATEKPVSVHAKIVASKGNAQLEGPYQLPRKQTSRNRQRGVQDEKETTVGSIIDVNIASCTITSEMHKMNKQQSVTIRGDGAIINNSELISESQVLSSSSEGNPRKHEQYGNMQDKRPSQVTEDDGMKRVFSFAGQPQGVQETLAQHSTLMSRTEMLLSQRPNEMFGVGLVSSPDHGQEPNSATKKLKKDKDTPTLAKAKSKSVTRSFRPSSNNSTIQITQTNLANISKHAEQVIQNDRKASPDVNLSRQRTRKLAGNANNQKGREITAEALLRNAESRKSEQSARRIQNIVQQSMSSMQRVSKLLEDAENLDSPDPVIKESRKEQSDSDDDDQIRSLLSQKTMLQRQFAAQKERQSMRRAGASGSRDANSVTGGTPSLNIQINKVISEDDEYSQKDQQYGSVMDQKAAIIQGQYSAQDGSHGGASSLLPSFEKLAAGRSSALLVGMQTHTASNVPAKPLTSAPGQRATQGQYRTNPVLGASVATESAELAVSPMHQTMKSSKRENKMFASDRKEEVTGQPREVPTQENRILDMKHEVEHYKKEIEKSENILKRAETKSMSRHIAKQGSSVAESVQPLDDFQSQVNIGESPVRKTPNRTRKLGRGSSNKKDIVIDDGRQFIVRGLTGIPELPVEGPTTASAIELYKKASTSIQIGQNSNKKPSSRSKVNRQSTKVGQTNKEDDTSPRNINSKNSQNLPTRKQHFKKVNDVDVHLRVTKDLAQGSFDASLNRPSEDNSRNSKMLESSVGPAKSTRLVYQDRARLGDDNVSVSNLVALRKLNDSLNSVMQRENNEDRPQTQGRGQRSPHYVKGVQQKLGMGANDIYLESVSHGMSKRQGEGDSKLPREYIEADQRNNFVSSGSAINIQKYISGNQEHVSNANDNVSEPPKSSIRESSVKSPMDFYAAQQASKAITEKESSK